MAQNDAPVTSSEVLVHGDWIKIGAAVFLSLGGENTEPLYVEEIYRLTILSGSSPCARNHAHHFSSRTAMIRWNRRVSTARDPVGKNV